jgi:hypothetical protein
MTCAICHDDMDMEEYKDEQESTQTCFKLECGHAFHTKCIIQVLSKTGHKCPSCNKGKTPEDKLYFQGMLTSMISEIRKDERVKYAKNEYNESVMAYKQVIKQLTIESRAWILNRANELKLYDHKLYYQKAKKSVMTEAKIAAKEIGPKYVGALESDAHANVRRGWGVSLVNKLLYGTHVPGYRDWRLNHPRIWMAL